jgi:hypothetical protein
VGWLELSVQVVVTRGAQIAQGWARGAKLADRGVCSPPVHRELGLNIYIYIYADTDSLSIVSAGYININ